MKLKNDYLIREFNGTIYAVSAEAPADKKNDPIVLNATGRILWQLLLSNTDEAKLVDALCAEYDIKREAAEADTKKFISELSDAGLLTEL